MSILVPGGAGYIGSHTVVELLEAGMDPVVVDNLSTGHLQAVPKEVPFYEGDLRDAGFLDTVFSKHKIEGVIHFAASSLVGESTRDPLKYYENNIGATTRLLQAMEKSGVRRMVFSSTAAVYGEPESTPILESDRTCPTNPYGETKLAIERMFAWCEKAHGLRYVALRYFNAAGAHPSGKIGEDHSPETHLIPIVLMAASGKLDHVSIFGDDYPTPDGTCLRDYIHVSDLGKAHVLAMRRLLDGGESAAYNLGNGSGFSVKEIISVAREVTGVNIKAQIAPRREGDPAVLIASSEKIRGELGWAPKYADLRQIIGSAWKWHSTHGVSD